MRSRYDYMRFSVVEDIDGDQYPDPLTIDYYSAILKEGTIPDSYKLSRSDLKKLWVKYHKEVGLGETDLTEMDDVLYSMNGIEHVGILEPEDNIFLYNTDNVSQFKFKDLR